MTFLISCLQILLACLPPGIDRVVYKPKKYSPKVIAFLPTGYIVHRTAAEGDTEYSYHYSDSSVFYISSFPTPHSYAEIRKANAFYDKRDARHLNKELVLAGKDSLGYYWKDRTVNDLSIGFYKVKGSKLVIMEKVMETLSVKK